MTQEAATSDMQNQAHGDEHSQNKNLLGPLLCWAVVFADIGTSVYYVPGILYGTVGPAAGFFVFLTMSVFVLLTLKYAEVTYRFPQGGGVVTVAAQAINHWVGALGGMFILVDYFLTAAISCLSGIFYLSVIAPAIGPPYALWITVGVLILLGILNWVGISESAKVSLVGAVIAFLSDIAILVTVFTHISLPAFFALIPDMFSNHTLTPISILIGFAGSFLAFSGLESISQLSPVMKTPRKKVAGMALLLVVLTIGLTSPLLTMLSTLLQPQEAADPLKNSQLISLLAGHWGNIILQTEVAISASALLVFASNTAIIGAYHVFMALSRMEFFPAFVLQRNKLRGTPPYQVNQPKISLWSTIDFYLGILTTVLVMIAWSTNLVAKPLATVFGGTVASAGMLVAYLNYMGHKRRGRIPVMITGVEGRLPGSVLAVLTGSNGHNDAVIRTAINNAEGHPVVFLYVNDKKPQTSRAPSIFEVVDPYLDDMQAKEYFSKAESLAQRAKIPRRYIYRQNAPGVVSRVWQAVHPRDIVVAANIAPEFEDVNPDRIRYELTPSGKVAHMLKQW